MKNKSKNESGFTVIELIIVVAILAVIASFGLFLSFDFYRSYSFRAEQETLLSALSKARAQAMTNSGQMKHGVHIENGKFVVFAGASYDSASPANEIISSQPTVSNSGPVDFIFEQISGSATSPASVTLTSGTRATTISTNYEGAVIW